MAAHSSVDVVRVLVTLLVVVVAFARAGRLVSAQTGYNECTFIGGINLNAECQPYFDSPKLSTPSASCCEKLSSVQSLYGASCYCEIVADCLEGSTDLDKAKFCALPKNCTITVDMALCSCPGTTSTPSPPVDLTPPAGVIATPPGVLPSPTTPTSTIPGTPGSTASASGGSTGDGSSSLAVPIGASVGGMSVTGFVIWLIMSKCRIHVKWDMNSPCWCCYRSQKPDKVPGATHIRV